jgi:hypothetical protein
LSVALCSPPVKALATLDPATRGFGLDRRLDTRRLAFMAGLVEVVVEAVRVELEITSSLN